MLVAIDPSIPDSQHLEMGVLDEATVLLLDPEVDGIVQISEYLDRHPRFSSLHLICHGAPGSLYIGNTKLDLGGLKTYQHLLSHWQNTFANFEILLYGCQVAKGERGRAFVNALGQMTGAAIAASADLTGNAALGGTRALECQTKAIATPLAFKTHVMTSYSSVLATFSANNTNELIARLNDANRTPEADIINLAANTTFDLTQAEIIDGNYGATGLPVILDDITINGNGSTIQRNGAAPNFRIFLIAGPGTEGFSNGRGKLTLDNVTVKGGRVGAGPKASDDGGGILNSAGELIIRNNSLVTENYAEDDGGGILNLGTGQGLAKVTIENSTISRNTARGDALDDGGAGIDNDGNKDSSALGAEMIIINSMITENRHQNGSGGGIRNVNGGVLTIQNSQITNNSSPFGSGISNGAASGVVGTRLTIGNTKIENNSGGGLDVQDAFDDSIGGPTTIVNEGGNTITTTNAPELLANPPSIRVSIDPNGPTIADGQPTAIAFGEMTQGATQTFTTFKIENLGSDPLNLGTPTLVGPSPNAFVLDTQGFLATLGENQSTTFKVALKTDTLGTFDAGVNFTASDPQITNPFDFLVAGTIAPPAPEIRVSIDPDGTPVLDNAPAAIALGNSPFGGTQPFTTFKIENIGARALTIATPALKGGVSSPFLLDTTGFNDTLGQNQSTTFKVSLKTDRVGQFDEEITFNTNDPKIAEPFEIKLNGAIDPTMLVELVDDRDRVIRTIVDGSPVPVNLGDLLPETTAQPAKFRITNKGTQNIDLGIPAIAGDANAFTLDTTGFLNSLQANQSTSFAIALNAPNSGTFNGKVEFTTTDASLAAPPFDFAIQGSLQPQAPPPPPPPPLGQGPNRLAFDRGGKLFAIGTEGGNALELQLTGEAASEFLQIGIAFQNADGSFGSPQPLFAPLPGRFRPNGFNASAQKFLRPNLNPGQQFRIILQNIDGGTLSVEPEVVETASGEYSLRFTQGVVLTVRQTVAQPPRGIGALQEQGNEIFDLRELSGSVRGNFSVYREAAFDNTVGFYEIDDTNGTVGGLAPGAAGYALAALERRVSGLDLAVTNQGTAGFSADLSGGKMYAPFIVIDGTVEEFLNDNPNNSASEDVVAYFLYQAANFDNTDHIRLLGQNTFGFEDMRNGGDRDFNDVIAVAEIG